MNGLRVLTRRIPDLWQAAGENNSKGTLDGLVDTDPTAKENIGQSGSQDTLDGRNRFIEQSTAYAKERTG